MLITAALVSLLTSWSTSAAPSDIAPRNTRPVYTYAPPPNACHPNFEGAYVSVTCSAVEWGTLWSPYPGIAITSTSHRGPMLQNPDFRFEFNGGPEGYYTIKDIKHKHLVVSVENDKLVFQQEDFANPWQDWVVSCDGCAEHIGQIRGHAAEGCNVTSPVNGKCVQRDTDPTAPLFLADCQHIDFQNFDFWTPTSI